MNLDPKYVFLDYRSPYAWQSRTINFNKQIIKKLNHVQKCKFKQQHQHHNKKVGNFVYQRNGQMPGLLHDISPITSSITPSLTSSSFDVREEVPFVKNSNTKKFQKNAVSNKMTRPYNDSHNAGAAVGHGPIHRHHHPPLFQSAANRCPVHGSCSPSHLSYKHGGPNRLEISPSGFSSLNDLKEYHHQSSNRYHLSYSSPYLYPPGDSNYPYPYPHGYYSSQLYMPGTCIPMQYFNNPSIRQSLYPHKMAMSAPAYRRTASFDYSNPMRLFAEEKKSVGRSCKGHLIVLAIILTVITIGVIMGVILAVTIN